MVAAFFASLVECVEAMTIVLAIGTVRWAGEGLCIAWPAGDWTILGLVIGFLIAATLAIWLCRLKVHASPPLLAHMEGK